MAPDGLRSPDGPDVLMAGLVRLPDHDHPRAAVLGHLLHRDPP